MSPGTIRSSHRHQKLLERDKWGLIHHPINGFPYINEFVATKGCQIALIIKAIKANSDDIGGSPMRISVGFQMILVGHP